jgi:hypothetical protein
MNAMTRIRGRFGVLAVGVLTLQACSDGGSTAAPLALALAAEGELAAAATVGTAVAPTVRLLDQRNQPLAGARITFEVTSGGGRMAESSMVTDATGRATAQWTLGTTAGTNTVVARPASGRTVTFNVVGTPDVPVALAAVAPVAELAAVSAQVSGVPAVRVADRYDNPVPGVEVSFTVTQGGGTVSAQSQTTGADGVASAGAWTVGEQQGENVMTATAAALAPVTFRTRAIAVSPDWVNLTRFAGDETTCPVNTTSCLFTVRATNVGGAPVAGEAILWRGPGGATATTVTNASGLATSPNIGARGTLGAFTQTAQLVSGTEVSFGYRLVAGNGFNIDVRFVSDATPAVRAAFENARARWQQVITGNLTEFSLTGSNQVQANACGITHPAVNEVVDDLLILVEVVPIDGPGKVLGSAGPCMLRGSNNLPILGVIKLDSDDLAMMDSNGTLRDVILHEMGHVLGIGTLWSRFSLVQGAGTADPLYTGARAQPGFVLGGGGFVTGVPVENSGGSGTRDAHWRESRLGSELMTGYINNSGNPLSAITVGALMDIGYQVNFGLADGYALPGLMSARSLEGVKQELVELPLPEPRRVW